MDKPAATRTSRRGVKRSRTHDACSCCSSSTQIPLRGAKRRSVSRLRPCSAAEARAPPSSWCSWGAKRARTALGRPGGSPPPRPKLSSDRNPLFESESVDGGDGTDWANLGEGPAGLIAERVLANDVADYIRFRSVCQPWRRCCAPPPADDALDRRFHPRQWIMFHEESRTHYHCRLLNLSTGECIRAHLPELRGHRVFRSSKEGLVLLLHESTHVARLLNPLTHQLTDLPPVTTFLDRLLLRGSIATEVGDLDVDGVGLADDRTVVIHTTSFLAVAKPGDKCWTAINLSGCIRPSMSFAGRFYCVTSHAIMVVEVRESQTPQLVEAADLTLQYRFSRMLGSGHLVENNGELLLVHRTLQASPSGDNRRLYQVYRVDLDGRKTVPVRGLGGRAVFIGHGCSLSVSPATFPSIVGDAVYPGFGCWDRTGQEHIDAYHLADGTIEHSYYEDIFKEDLEHPCSIADCLSLYV